MRSDEDVHLACGEVRDHLLRLGGLAKSGHHLDVEREVPEAVSEGVPVLLGEDGRRAEDENLPAVHRHGEGGPNGYLGLSEPDISAHEPVHRPRGLEILFHGLDRAGLVVRFAIGERCFEPIEPLVGEIEARSLGALPLGVEREQLAGQLANGFTGAALEVLPGLASELRERGRLRVGPDVSRELAELLVGDVEPVVAAERQEEIVAGDAGDLFRLEAEELAHAVILVDDVVADTKIGECRERTPEPRVRAWRSLAKDLRVREKDEAKITPDEATPGR